MSASASVAKYVGEIELCDTPPAKKAAEALSIVRKAPLYRPTLVLELGEIALKALSKSSIGYWDLLEQIANAAIENRNWSVFERLLSSLQERFPKSWRVALLRGRKAEAKGKYEDAMDVYKAILESDAQRGVAYKRQIAVLKQQRKTSEAIALLNYYLSIFSTDQDAWAELCSLCLARGRLNHALYAANELLVINRFNYAAHILVADVYMTLGGRDNVIAARRHYAASLARNEKCNLRALYGLWLAASTLELNASASSVEKAHSDEDSDEPGDDGDDEDLFDDEEDDEEEEEGEERNEVNEDELKGPESSNNRRVLAWASVAIQSVYTGREGQSRMAKARDTLVVAQALRGQDGRRR